MTNTFLNLEIKFYQYFLVKSARIFLFSLNFLEKHFWNLGPKTILHIMLSVQFFILKSLHPNEAAYSLFF